MKDKHENKEHPLDDRPILDQLLGEDIDDTVREAHQDSLRDKVLEAFDQSLGSHSVSEPIASPAERQTTHWIRVVGAVAALAACLIGIALLWPSESADRTNRKVVLSHPPRQDATIDSRLIASLAAVESFRDQVPPEALFAAIAICQTEHDQAYSNSQQP